MWRAVYNVSTMTGFRTTPYKDHYHVSGEDCLADHWVVPSSCTYDALDALLIEGVTSGLLVALASS